MSWDECIKSEWLRELHCKAEHTRYIESKIEWDESSDV